MASLPPHKEILQESGNCLRKGRMISMKLHLLDNRAKRGYTTFGVIWEKGENTGKKNYIVKTAEGKLIPVQSRVTAYYPDNSIKWTAHTVNVDYLTEEIELIAADPVEAGERMPVLTVEDRGGSYHLSGQDMEMNLPKCGEALFTDFRIKGRTAVERAFPVLQIERRKREGDDRIACVNSYTGKIKNLIIEEKGPYRITARFEGIHENPKTGEELFPFVIRLQVGSGEPAIRLMHTFLYDGVEERDLLKGIGIRFLAPVSGEPWHRYVKALGDHGTFYESEANLVSFIPRTKEELFDKQMNDPHAELTEREKAEVADIIEEMPHWDSWYYTQEHHGYFRIRKKIGEEDVCLLDCLEGTCGKGAMAFGSESGNISFAIRDFDKKTPCGFSLEGLSGQKAAMTAWFYDPMCEAFDFRHYAKRGYGRVCYEGYDFKGDSAYGVAVTSEMGLIAGEDYIVSDQELEEFAKTVNCPPVFVAEPEEYHKKRAFGYWSLPVRSTETEGWLENQLETVFEFYKKEVEQRNWYGLFNYGDFMHTYDQVRHCWRYDIGGYAWDNTELVPTLWLWLYFMRTGREDVFTLAEKLSRHTSEVDVYHFGKFKGMGSRHNVRHWGCACKEARIAMAGHHRCCYFLTGDFRFEDIFDEIKDNEMTFLEKDPLANFYKKEGMVYPSHARTGPDWSSLCSNWMTQWERFGDKAYLEKIKIGMEDIKKAPLQLISGPDFEFDPASKHLRYIGDRSTGGTHLQICMGAAEVWLELAVLMGDREWERMLADYGRFYYLSKENQVKESGGITADREFSLPYMAAAIGAYGAWYFQDKDLAKTVWKILLMQQYKDGKPEGFCIHTVNNRGNRELLSEIPRISTNHAAQWSLNVIMALEFIRDALPDDVEGMGSLVNRPAPVGYRDL